MARQTRQREAIEAAFRQADRPLSPWECLTLAQRRVPRLGIATVYRNIRRLVDEGHLQVVSIPGASDRYEVEGKSHHHHFYCRSCDRLYEVDRCTGLLPATPPTGFHLERHDLILYGLCATCSPA
jgi:Fur family ferric uptake transcriptional regulator